MPPTHDDLLNRRALYIGEANTLHSVMQTAFDAYAIALSQKNAGGDIAIQHHRGHRRGTTDQSRMEARVHLSTSTRLCIKFHAAMQGIVDLMGQNLVQQDLVENEILSEVGQGPGGGGGRGGGGGGRSRTRRSGHSTEGAVSVGGRGRRAAIASAAGCGRGEAELVVDPADEAAEPGVELAEAAEPGVGGYDGDGQPAAFSTALAEFNRLMASSEPTPTSRPSKKRKLD